jgi:hypothetical protein
VFFFCFGALGWAQSISSKRFLEEAPLAWEEYRTVALRFQGTSTRRTDVDGRTVGIGRVEFKHNEESSSVLFRSLDGSAPDKFFAFNPKYSFALRRTSEDAPWTILKLRSAAEGVDSAVQWEIESDSESKAVLTNVHARKLLDLLKQPNFRVLDLKQARLPAHSAAPGCSYRAAQGERWAVGCGQVVMQHWLGCFLGAA